MKTIFGTLAFISFFLMIGTVGAMDCRNISLLHGAIQGGISIFCFAVFSKLAGAFEPCVKSNDNYYDDSDYYNTKIKMGSDYNENFF